MSEPGEGRFDEVDPNRDITLVGFVRKDKSKATKFLVLWAHPTTGGSLARLEVYADDKALLKKKSPKTKILIRDIEVCEPVESNSSPSSRDLHRFVIKFKNGDKFYYNCTTVGEQSSWCAWIHDYVTGQPDPQRYDSAYTRVFSNVKIVPADLGDKTGLANGVPQPCTLAFSENNVSIFFAQRPRPQFTVQVRLLRSAGYSGKMMHFQCGRRTQCGEGYMFFEATTEYEAKMMKEALFEEMNRRTPQESPPVTVPSPRQHQYPVSAPSMAYAITNNARPPQPIPSSGSFTNSGHQSPPIGGPDHSLSRSSSDAYSVPGSSSRDGSMRIASHRPRAAAVSTQPRQYSRQNSEPCVSNSFSRQASLRGPASASYGSEADESFMASSTPSRRTVYEEMQSPWQPRSAMDPSQDAYEDMRPTHSRTNSTVSNVSNSIHHDSSLDELDHRLSAVSVDSVLSSLPRTPRAIPDELTESEVPYAPGLYTNKAVQQDVSSPSDSNYMNVEPIRTQRSSRNKHLQVRQYGPSDREYENVWVVCNNPAKPSEKVDMGPYKSAPLAIPVGTPRNSRLADDHTSSSWHNTALPVAAFTNSGSRSSFPSENGCVFPMDDMTSPPQQQQQQAINAPVAQHS